MSTINTQLTQAYQKLAEAKTPQAQQDAVEEVNQLRKEAGQKPIEEAGAETGAAQAAKGQLDTGAYNLQAQAISTLWAGTSNIASDTKEVNIDDLIQKLGLMEKYNTNQKYTGDIYNINNPQLKKFQEFLADGIVDKLAEAGCSRNDIIDIVEKVFPRIGISRQDKTKDAYKVPYGHGTAAAQTYRGSFKDSSGNTVNGFLSQLASASVSSPEIVQAEGELKALVNKYNKNINSLKQTASEIKRCESEIKVNINAAKSKTKEIAAKTKEKAKETAEKEIKKYKNSEGSMTYSQFQINLSSKLNSIHPDFSAAINYMNSAEAQMSSLKSFAGRITELQNANSSLKDSINAKNAEIAALRVTESEDTKKSVKMIDPIGFFMEDGSRVDLFVDKDNNNDLSNENEFLGSQKGWSEMTALDTTGADGVSDGIVDRNEIAQAGLKAVVTHTDGSQEIVDAAEFFKDSGIEIDLGSYAAGGSTIEGTDNILAGTFTANVNGQALNGFNTLDTLDWLDNNYTFSDKTEGKGRFAQGDIASMLQEPDIKLDSKISSAQAALSEGWKEIGVERSTIEKDINSFYKEQAELEASKIADDFARQEAEKAEAEDPKEPAKFYYISADIYMARNADDRKKAFITEFQQMYSGNNAQRTGGTETIIKQLKTSNANSGIDHADSSDINVLMMVLRKFQEKHNLNDIEGINSSIGADADAETCLKYAENLKAAIAAADNTALKELKNLLDGVISDLEHAAKTDTD